MIANLRALYPTSRTRWEMSLRKGDLNRSVSARAELGRSESPDSLQGEALTG